jgi:hypothetical protein
MTCRQLWRRDFSAFSRLRQFVANLRIRSKKLTRWLIPDNFHVHAWSFKFDCLFLGDFRAEIALHTLVRMLACTAMMRA